MQPMSFLGQSLMLIYKFVSHSLTTGRSVPCRNLQWTNITPGQRSMQHPPYRMQGWSQQGLCPPNLATGRSVPRRNLQWTAKEPLCIPRFLSSDLSRPFPFRLPILASFGKDGVTRSSPTHFPEEDPPPVLTPPGLADVFEPTIIQKLQTEKVEYDPAFLSDRRTFGQPVANFLWGTMTQGNHGTYTVFDRLRHVTVEKCQWHADFESVAALAIARAPFAVRSIQLLTKPIEGLPKPQIVIAEFGRPPGELPIPWDLRDIGMQIRTIRHQPEQDAGAALRDLQTQLPPGTDLEGLWREGHIHLSDALGPVAVCLPATLTDSQHFHAQRIPLAALNGHVLHQPLYFGGTGARESTATTTWVYAVGTAPSPPALRVTIFRGEVSISLDIRPPYGMMDEVVARLLAQHAELAPFSSGATLTLARAFPPSLGYLQEVLLCISDDPSIHALLFLGCPGYQWGSDSTTGGGRVYDQ